MGHARALLRHLKRDGQADGTPASQLHRRVFWPRHSSSSPLGTFLKHWGLSFPSVPGANSRVYNKGSWEASTYTVNLVPALEVPCRCWWRVVVTGPPCHVSAGYGCGWCDWGRPLPAPTAPPHCCLWCLCWVGVRTGEGRSTRKKSKLPLSQNIFIENVAGTWTPWPWGTERLVSCRLRPSCSLSSSGRDCWCRGP